MTWYFDPYGTQLDVYDHTGTLIVSGVPYSGTWSDDFPDEIFDIMYQEALDAYQTNDNRRLLRILADAAFERIEQGTPP